ncbi:MAG: N-glycosylase/DNA lyase [Nanoarchaeota archaeon]|nr:N-glycosylase/DNA lyase [Nanoarchaeota archaeon]
MEILQKINDLKKTEIAKTIDFRIKEFERVGKERDENKIFSELCFCILTANFNAERGIKIQKELEKDFCSLSEKQLSLKLKELGHRFPNARANYISYCQKYNQELIEVLYKRKLSEDEIRQWLVKNIKGLGMKEASHFLRNIGFKHFAIIDFHIIDLLAREKMIQKPKSKSLSKKEYVKIEEVLKEIAKKADLNLAELDLYLWYIETGKVLK